MKTRLVKLLNIFASMIVSYLWSFSNILLAKLDCFQLAGGKNEWTCQHVVREPLDDSLRFCLYAFESSHDLSVYPRRCLVIWSSIAPWLPTLRTLYGSFANAFKVAMRAFLRRIVGF